MNDMKKLFLTLIFTLLSFNFGVLILNLKDFGIKWDFDLILDIHYTVSIYALKCGVIAFIARYIYEKSTSKNGSK